jgi:hypothetical protein
LEQIESISIIRIDPICVLFGFLLNSSNHQKVSEPRDSRIEAESFIMCLTRVDSKWLPHFSSGAIASGDELIIAPRAKAEGVGKWAKKAVGKNKATRLRLREKRLIDEVLDGHRGVN